MRLSEALILLCCASPALAQHEGHGSHGAPGSPARFDFQAALLHGDHDSNHGHSQFGFRDWEHFRSRGFFGDRLTLRGMTSLGALIPDSAGIPALLQTGGTYRLGYIHDRQHPEELVMEAAAEFRTKRLFFFAAPVGAPALGPEAYLHRPSAAGDPIAPLAHHWQDATHVSYGVATIGARLGGATLETSVFNARESDVREPWPDFRGFRLDSYSARLTADAGGLSLSGWYGFLAHHDPAAPAMSMHRYGASASLARGRSSTLAVWGMNIHHHDAASHVLMHGDPNASPHAYSSSLLLETSVAVGAKQTVYARAERVMKSGEELGFQGGDLMALYDIRQLAVGARRDVWATRQAAFAVGARGAFTFLPRSLEPTYGTRRPVGLDLSIQARRAP